MVAAGGMLWWTLARQSAAHRGRRLDLLRIVRGDKIGRLTRAYPDDYGESYQQLRRAQHDQWGFRESSRCGATNAREGSAPAGRKACKRRTWTTCVPLSNPNSRFVPNEPSVRRHASTLPSSAAPRPFGKVPAEEYATSALATLGLSRHSQIRRLEASVCQRR